MRKYLDKKAVGSGVRGGGLKAQGGLHQLTLMNCEFFLWLLSLSLSPPLFLGANACESFSVGGCGLLKSYSFSLVLLFHCSQVRTFVHFLFFQSICFLKADLHLTRLSSSQILSSYSES